MLFTNQQELLCRFQQFIVNQLQLINQLIVGSFIFFNFSG